MKLESTNQSVAEITADALVINLREGEPLAGRALEVDRATAGLISRLLEQDEISASRYSVNSILAPAGIQARRIVTVGLGKNSNGAEAQIAFRAAAAATRHLGNKKRGAIAYLLDLQPAWAAVAGAVSASVGQDQYRQKKKSNPAERLVWVAVGDQELRRGESIGRGILTAKKLVNDPPNLLYPEILAEHCVRLEQSHGLEVEVWDRDRLEKERCRGILAVSQGSARPPRLVILRYRGNESSTPQLGWVGKGVTFDSGGLSIKPSESMIDMKMDMAGAAAVIGALQAVAELKLPVHIVGLIGCTENLLGSQAYKVGDVITARSGTTIEILNTDAEGRVVLADVLNVAVEKKCARLVDLATLTGACMVALGKSIAGVMTNSQSWCDQVLEAADRCGEEAWQLPMNPLFDEQIESAVADIKNVGDGRWGGAITAGKFLERFVDDTPWVHIDIAGPSFLDKPVAWCDAGASGCFVNTLVQLAQQIAEQPQKSTQG